ncbi:MAG TPA: type I DNA topoisomerase [Clostridiales bacterium]|nr:type I DNA topoisomerase [Clostridiales bacterium]
MAPAKTLVIVESPSKARTIGKFLGSRYKVIASAGHIVDLPKSRLAVDIENNFEPEYINVRGRASIIKEIKKEASKADHVLLATDPDREGEAISWHISNLLGMDETQANRIVFNEITKPAIREAIQNPRPIDMNLVNAQQARRVLDRVVGYKISPILWSKVKRGLSAGRVQSAALKILCDRERLIQDFVPREYWVIAAELAKGTGKEAENKRHPFSARLAEHNGKKLTIDDRAQTERILQELKSGSFSVASVETKERVKKPWAPYTTSSLQQDASIKLGFSPKKTMLVAQQLYEGCEVKGHGTIGLVSYIRTDSVRISSEADAACKAYINEHFAPEYVGNNRFVNKKKEVQDAHEAIRPSYVDITPDEAKASLTGDQWKLYRLIWSRFVASRMTPAVFDVTIVEVQNGAYGLKAQGSHLRFDGYLKIYDDNDKEDKDKTLPKLQQGDPLMLLNIDGEQNFTQPPSRFTEASLIKELEEKDIGRPSTYAPIVSTLVDRRYVIREKKSLVPTDLGFVVTQIMEDYFKEIADVNFTADMEGKLDDVETKSVPWQSVVGDLYHGSLKKELEEAESQIEKVHLPPVLSDEVCELCGKPMAIKEGRFGSFLACTGFPDCKNTKPIIQKVGVACPSCGKDLIFRKSKKGKVFYGCSGYPECQQVYWDKPVNKVCPECGNLLVEKKSGKTKKLKCSNPNCTYSEESTT